MAEMMRGELLGEPERETPDLRVSDKGGGEEVCAAARGEGEYESLRDGPEGKCVRREREKLE